MRILVPLALAVALPPAAFAQVSVNPKVGISISDLNKATAEVDTRSRLGFQAGVDLRLGGVVYLQPGVYVQQTGVEQMVAGNVNYNLDVRGVHVPLLLGVKAGTGLAGFRMVAGPAVTIVQSVKDNVGLVTKEDLTGTRLGAMIGVGVDLLGLTVDLTTEGGLTRFFEQGSDAKLRTFRLSAGMRF